MPHTATHPNTSPGRSCGALKQDAENVLGHDQDAEHRAERTLGAGLQHLGAGRSSISATHAFIATGSP
jgi:hypothetical protein